MVGGIEVSPSWLLMEESVSQVVAGGGRGEQGRGAIAPSATLMPYKRGCTIVPAQPAFSRDLAPPL